MSEEEPIRNLNEALCLLAMLEHTINGLAQRPLMVNDPSWRGVQLTIGRCRSIIQTTNDKLTRELYQTAEPLPEQPLQPEPWKPKSSLISRIQRLPSTN